MANRGDGKEKAGGSGAGMSCLVIGAGVLVGGICVIGVLAAVVIPAFISYVKRSKATEARMNLVDQYQAAAAYYAEEHMGPDGTMVRACTVDPSITPNIPGAHKTSLTGRWPQPFVELGATPSDPLYYRYEIVGGPARCGVGPNESIYTFRAYGDLDDDGVLSTFELAVSSDANNELIRSGGVHIVQELE